MTIRYLLVHITLALSLLGGARSIGCSNESNEEREPHTSSPAPVLLVREKDSPSSKLRYQMNTAEKSHIHNHQNFCPQQNSLQPPSFEVSQQVVYHQISPPGHRRPYHYKYPPATFQQRYQSIPRRDDYHHPSCINEGNFHEFASNPIEPIPYPPAPSATVDIGDLHRVVPPDAGVAAHTPQSLEEEEDHSSLLEKDPFLEQINQVLGPLVDDTEDSCFSI